MLTVNSSKRACADEILNNRNLQLRAQDYTQRNSFSQAKIKMEKLNEECKLYDSKIEEQNKIIKQQEKLNTSALSNLKENELDKQILEMQSKLKQIRFTNSKN